MFIPYNLLTLVLVVHIHGVIALTDTVDARIMETVVQGSERREWVRKVGVTGEKFRNLDDVRREGISNTYPSRETGLTTSYLRNDPENQKRKSRVQFTVVESLRKVFIDASEGNSKSIGDKNQRQRNLGYNVNNNLK